jgi:hypothetical protein
VGDGRSGEGRTAGPEVISWPTLERHPGRASAVLRIEAVSLTAVIFLGFNVAWLMLFDVRQPSHAPPPAAAP